MKTRTYDDASLQSMYNLFRRDFDGRRSDFGWLMPFSNAYERGLSGLPCRFNSMLKAAWAAGADTRQDTVENI